MPESEKAQPPGIRIRARCVVFAVLAMGLAALSVHGALDDYGSELIDNTTTESIGIFLVARTINAGVSTLQTSTVGAGFTMQIGEALDPVNDAVERLSSVMVWAIGSLLLQGLAIDLAASAVFQWGFAAIAVATAILLFAADQNFANSTVATWVPRCRDFAFRAFAIALMIRFAVPLFVLVSVLLSGLIVQKDLDKSKESVQVHGEIFGIEPESITNEVGLLDANLPESNAESGAEDESGFLDFGFIRRPIAAIQAALREFTVGIADRLDVSDRINEMLAVARELVENLTRLLVYVALKNILLPLVFLAFAMKGAVPLTRYLVQLGTGGGVPRD